MYFATPTDKLFHWIKQSSSQMWFTMGIDQFTALVVFRPEMLWSSVSGWLTGLELRKVRNGDLLCCYHDGVGTRHVRSELGAHSDDKSF